MKKQDEPTKHIWMNGEGKTFGSFSEVVQYICEKGREERKIKAMERLADAMEQQFKQVAPETQHPQGITGILPKEALTIIERAIEKRMIEKTATGYKWLMGLQMLSCFAREMSIKFNMGKGRIAWKPFEILFGIERGKLRLNYNDIQKTGQAPKDAHMIDELYE